MDTVVTTVGSTLDMTGYTVAVISQVVRCLMMNCREIELRGAACDLMTNKTVSIYISCLGGVSLRTVKRCKGVAQFRLEVAG